MLNWSEDRETKDTITAIVDRIERDHPRLMEGRTRMDWLMDIEVAHCNGCELELNDLLRAEGFDFVHDVAGIANHLNRLTGELEDCFLPRFAVPADMRVTG